MKKYFFALSAFLLLMQTGLLAQRFDGLEVQ